MTKQHEMSFDKVPLRGQKIGAKRPHEQKSYTAEDYKKKAMLDKEIEKIQDKHRPKLSIDAQYLDKTILRNASQAEKLTRKESTASFFEENKGAGIEEWIGSEKAQALQQQEGSFDLEIEVFGQEAARRLIGSDDIDKSHRRGWMQLYTMSPSGPGLSRQDAGMGPRDHMFPHELVQTAMHSIFGLVTQSSSSRELGQVDDY